MDSFSLLLFISFLFVSTSLSLSQRPKALVSQVTKDPSTLQYLTKVSQRTPLVSVNLVLDLGGRFIWIDCDKNYISSTYHPARCRSAECSLANSVACGNCSLPARPGCNNNTCGEFPENPIIHTSTGGELATDYISFTSTDGSNTGPVVTDPHFVFVCGPTFLLKGLARGSIGMAGLGRTKIAFPEQLAAYFSFDRTFALCLSSSTGALFFGDGPYVFLPGIDVSNSLLYTPLLVNPVSTAGTFTKGEKSTEYFIGVKSININNQQVKLNQSLLTIDSNGIGGTKISTVNPYTLLEQSIYKAILNAFSTAINEIKPIKAVPPFGLCFDPKSFGSTRVGPAVPTIDLVLHTKKVYWRIFGANSMVLVNDGALCLGFVNAGTDPRTSIVIGGKQLEDNLLEFDLARNRLGFSSSLFFRQTTCANFNFSTKA